MHPLRAEVVSELTDPAAFDGVGADVLGSEFTDQDLATDGEILKVARETAMAILESDPHLALDKHLMIREQVMHQRKETTNWARIS